jgi:hypothetical protein
VNKKLMRKRVKNLGERMAKNHHEDVQHEKMEK